MILSFRMIPGGFILGPLVQKFAFGEYWTGWPFGGDWTDNKTLAALVAWLVAWAICRWRPRFQRPAVLLAAIVMFAVDFAEFLALPEQGNPFSSHEGNGKGLKAIPPPFIAVK